MDPINRAQEILDTILGYLGFAAEVQTVETKNGMILEIITENAPVLIGHRGERLDDIQHLVNRLLMRTHPDAPLVRVDVQHYRVMMEDEMADEARALAERVKLTGKPYTLPPLNSYDRRLVHNALVDMPEVETWSPPEKARVKRMVIRPVGSSHQSSS